MGFGGSRAVATAPVRVADVGGWTDTWFGAPGRVCHLAVEPGVTVEAELRPASRRAAPVELWPEDLGDAYEVRPHPRRGWSHPRPLRHPLLEHAVAAMLAAVAVPDRMQLVVHIRAAVPAGASLGTSASVLVALVGALCGLFGEEGGAIGGKADAATIAALAHRVETVAAGRESGVQDQQAAAHGGVGLLTIDPYPEARWHRVQVPDDAWRELDEQLVTVTVGAHDSSAVHRAVIDAVTDEDGVAHASAVAEMRRLALLAPTAAATLTAGDLDAWARTLTAATEVQERLHPDLVGPAHRQAIEIARSHGARGWKVNGAGGAGGSLTVLASGDRRGLVDDLASVPGWTVPELHPSTAGLVVSVS